ncbi:MAG: hypothetical protein IMF10_05285 [Proteobacteria bacterium]|nr:hypothetical protein [Pseudomonadota bacterium]
MIESRGCLPCEIGAAPVKWSANLTGQTFHRAGRFEASLAYALDSAG